MCIHIITLQKFGKCFKHYFTLETSGGGQFVVATVYHDKEVLGTKDGCLETRKGKKKKMGLGREGGRTNAARAAAGMAC